LTGARVPVDLTLTTDDREDVPPGNGARVKVAVSIDSGCQFESEQSANYWTDYSGVINPPRPVPPPQAAIDAIGENVIAFTMGAEKSLRLKNGQTMLVEVEVAMASSLPAPVVYYIPTNGTPELAGVSGVRDGIAYGPGGYILASRVDTPEPGYTTYTIGLLFDHMSVYVAGPPVDSDGGNDGGFCFIDTLTYGPQPSPIAQFFRWFGNNLRPILLLAPVLAWAVVSRCMGRLRGRIDGGLRLTDSRFDQ